MERHSARAVPKERRADGAYVFTARLGDEGPIEPGRYFLSAEALVSEVRASRMIDRHDRSPAVPLEVRP